MSVTAILGFACLSYCEMSCEEITKFSEKNGEMGKEHDKSRGKFSHLKSGRSTCKYKMFIQISTCYFFGAKIDNGNRNQKKETDF